MRDCLTKGIVFLHFMVISGMKQTKEKPKIVKNRWEMALLVFLALRCKN